MSALIDMSAVAVELDVHYDTVRKQWAAWVRGKGFPAPVETRPYKWNLPSIESYKARREAANREAVLKLVPDAPANDRPGPGPAGSREARQREAVLRLMQGRI